MPTFYNGVDIVGKYNDLTGQKFGELVVLGRDLEYPKINNIKKKLKPIGKFNVPVGIFLLNHVLL